MLCEEQYAWMLHELGDLPYEAVDDDHTIQPGSVIPGEMILPVYMRG